MANFEINEILLNYKNAAEQELHEILDWWALHMIDEKHGGFYGEMDNDNKINIEAPKGIVLNSRILWSFSAGYSFNPKVEYKEIAHRAYGYIIENFIDKEFDGVYWSVDQHGEMHDSKKQIYGLAFCIYGLAEYYKVVKDENVLQHAINLYKCVEKYSYDERYGGYIEALSREWLPADDLRLSEKDDNEKKSMNTHLHVMEGYANLYSVWQDEYLKKRIIRLLDNFQQHIIHQNNYHLNLFFDEAWNLRSTMISYGHDIEAAWLLQECAEIIDEHAYIEKYKESAIKMAVAAAEGFDETDGGLYYEYDLPTKHYITEKHWWPQAEAMVGFLNAYQLTGDEKFLHLSVNSFAYIQNHLKDKKFGEWFWGVDLRGNVMQKEKAGFWKCPYHNSRACMEVSRRIAALINV